MGLWQPVVDAESNEQYYWNVETQETSWKHPERLLLPAYVIRQQFLQRLVDGKYRSRLFQSSLKQERDPQRGIQPIEQTELKTALAEVQRRFVVFDEELEAQRQQLRWKRGQNRIPADKATTAQPESVSLDPFDMYWGAPVPSAVATGFINACTEEITNKHQGCIQNFLSNGLTEEERNSLSPLEEFIRMQACPGAALENLVQTWRAPLPPSEILEPFVPCRSSAPPVSIPPPSRTGSGMPAPAQKCSLCDRLQRGLKPGEACNVCREDRS